MARIAVIGSAGRDEVMRLSTPLRAGAHLNGSSAGSRLGGGGANTAVALAAAGHHVTLLTAVGRDAVGDAVVGELHAAGVDTSQLFRLDGATTRSLVLVDPQGERTVVNLARCEEAEPPQRLLTLAADAVYVRSRRLDLAPLLARKAEGALVVAHVPPLDPGSRPAQVLVASASDLDRELTRDPLALGRSVAGERVRWVVVTAGAAGAKATSEREVQDVPAESVSAVDTTGAGDAFAAGLVHALASGASMRDAMRLAVRFGTEATRWFASALPPEAVRRLLR
ncbi:MAG: bifunctional hydroxymethylpyrimidine kinase/phosphomethylpyrimidine kinase [Betaproteobacteria bacterium]|nr:bifunctional hydroxymethylpyrimidine kinase/phosphomethylpyrimidine kinase [Betaproteobacteria bacterium]